MYGIFTYIWLIFMVNVGKYTSPMECLGIVSWIVADTFVEPTGHQPNSAIPTELFAS